MGKYSIFSLNWCTNFFFFLGDFGLWVPMIAAFSLASKRLLVFVSFIGLWVIGGSFRCFVLICKNWENYWVNLFIIWERKKILLWDEKKHYRYKEKEKSYKNGLEKKK